MEHGTPGQGKRAGRADARERKERQRAQVRLQRREQAPGAGRQACAHCLLDAQTPAHEAITTIGGTAYCVVHARMRARAELLGARSRQQDQTLVYTVYPFYRSPAALAEPAPEPAPEVVPGGDDAPAAPA